MTDSYRLFVELPNGAKFRAHGDVAEVRVDLEQFYDRLVNVVKLTTSPTANVSPNIIMDDGNTEPIIGAVADMTSQPSLLPEGLDQTTLDRLFAKDKHGTVSLRALPSGDNAEGNALVALIYGANRLANEQQVTGSRLMKAASQSGLSRVDRIDRFLRAEIGHHVTAAGFKKGRRYGLTNPGIRRAEEILTAILG